MFSLLTLIASNSFADTYSCTFRSLSTRTTGDKTCADPKSNNGYDITDGKCFTFDNKNPQLRVTVRNVAAYEQQNDVVAFNTSAGFPATAKTTLQNGNNTFQLDCKKN